MVNIQGRNQSWEFKSKFRTKQLLLQERSRRGPRIFPQFNCKLSFVYSYSTGICKENKLNLIFFKFKWPFCNRFIYLIYRLFVAIYYTIWFVESIARNVNYRAKNTYIMNKEKKNLLLLHVIFNIQFNIKLENFGLP